MKVAVLMGGSSAEREISLRSGHAVLTALARSGVEALAFDPAVRPLAELPATGCDVAFIALHGRMGEDGAVQGALEFMGIPYTGSGVAASALAMDKWRSKLVWRELGIPTPPWVRVAGNDAAAREAVLALGLPVMVKPAREGSSIGMTLVREVADLGPALEAAADFDDLLLVERYVTGMELTVSLVGDRVLPVIRLETPREFYDFHAKYSADDTRYHCPSGLGAVEEDEVGQLARQAFDALGCRGWGRVDLMRDGAGRPWFLEVNTAPGMTDHSLVPMAARAEGMDMAALVRAILAEAALEFRANG